MKTLLPLFFALLAHFTFGQFVSTMLDDPATKITDDLLYDDAGNLYGADYSGDAVYKMTPSGTVTTFVSGLDAPNGLAFDSQGNLFVCDNTGNAIYKVDPLGNFLDTFLMASPSGIIKDIDSDTMFFTQYAGHKLNKLAPDGSIIEWFAGTPLNGPVGLDYDDNDQLYLANFTDRKLFRVYQDSLEHFATMPGTNTFLGFICYAQSSLWATSFNRNEIYRIYPEYADSSELIAGGVMGTTDGHVDSAKFSRPNGIIGSLTGDSIIISEYATGRLRVLYDITAGITSVGDIGKISVYPNPSSGTFHVKFETLIEDAELLVIRMDGRVVKERQISQTTSLEINDFPSGVYLLRIKKADGSQWTTRLISN